MSITVKRPIAVGYERLKPGPSNSPERVRESQRTRIQMATAELTAEVGYTRLTVRGLTRTAKVSTRTFYAQFANLEDCFASTHRAIMGGVRDGLGVAMAAAGDYEVALRTWIRQLTESVAEDPSAASLSLVAAYDGGPAMLIEISQGIDELERQLLAIRPSLKGPLVKGIVAGIERVLRTWLLTGKQAELPQVADDLAEWALSAVHLVATPPPSTPQVHSRSSRFRDQIGNRDPGLAVFESIGGERGRILAATVRLGASDGYWSLTAPRIRRQAGVSRRNFEQLFDGVAGCYLEAIEVLMQAATIRAARESAAACDWADRIGRFTRRFCTEVSCSPLLARLAFVGVMEPGAEGLRCRENLVTGAATWLCVNERDRIPVAPLAIEASLAAGWRVVQDDLMSGLDFHRDANTMSLLLLAPSVVQRKTQPSNYVG